MRRETSNRLRHVIEDWLPPAIRDSALFGAIMRLAWSDAVDRFAHFRSRAAFVTPAEFAELYRDYPHLHDATDNSRACVERISREALGTSVLDVGCGSGWLLRHLQKERPDLRQLAGFDIAPPVDAPGQSEIAFHQGTLETLPFEDGAFDTVVCTHVLEHVLDLAAAIAELRRVCARRLILVVPREREGRYTFNPHLHFFPYRHSFLRTLRPVPENHVCTDIGRDIYYREDLG